MVGCCGFSFLVPKTKTSTSCAEKWIQFAMFLYGKRLIVVFRAMCGLQPPSGAGIKSSASCVFLCLRAGTLFSGTKSNFDPGLATGPSHDQEEGTRNKNHAKIPFLSCETCTVLSQVATPLALSR